MTSVFPLPRKHSAPRGHAGGRSDVNVLMPILLNIPPSTFSGRCLTHVGKEGKR